MSSHKEHSKRHRIPGGIIFGLVLIFLGAAFLLDNLRLIYIDEVLQFLPCILIVMGLVRLWNKGILNIWGQILVVGGTLLQIAFLGFDVAIIELWWPTLIIWLGLIIAIRAFLPKKNSQEIQSAPSNEHQWHQYDVIDAPPIKVEIENEEEEQ